LCDDALLAGWGVDAETRATLANKIPRTELVLPEHADDLWARRKQLFFKPAAGYGSKAAYRGDKVTKRVFEEMLAGSYIAQALVPPSSRTLQVGCGAGGTQARPAQLCLCRPCPIDRRAPVAGADHQFPHAGRRLRAGADRTFATGSEKG
jgi:hypothetical protein